MKKLCITIFLLTTLFFTGSTFSEPVWVPAKINGQKGDMVLSAGKPGELINDLVAIFGGYWNHIGLLTDNGYTIRHNTMYIQDIPQEKNGCGIPYRLNPDGLSNGLPGILTQDVDTTYNHEDPNYRSFNIAGGAIVMPKDENEDSYRQYLELATDKMIFLKGYYRIHAYVDMMQMEDLDYLVKGVGNHCSGTIWFAHHYTGKTMNVATIPPDVIKACSFQLYDSVYKMVEEEIGCGKVFSPDVAGDVANQVVNTFGFDRSEDMTDYWKENIDQVTAYVNSPDHLLLSSFTNPSGENVGVQTESSSYYGKVVPIEWTDGYWVDDGDDDNGDDNDDGDGDGCN